MISIEKLIEERKQYYVLLEKVESAKKHIDDSIKEINSAIENYNKSYMINEKRADNNNLTNVKDSLSATSARLSINIEKINNNISNLGKMIDQYYEDAAALAASSSAVLAKEKTASDKVKTTRETALRNKVDNIMNQKENL